MITAPTPADVVATPRSAAPARAMFRVHPALWLALGAILLRVIVFTSRGDYIAFDEGWYLLLGRSLFNGDGYTLSGLRHTTLSPLFPVFAGAVGALVGDVVLGGRIVAAVCAGLLVVPCWHIFNRIAGGRVATMAGVFIAVMPSLAPFAAPYWIEWDLWVGAEPVLHLFLYSAVALALRARDTARAADWLLAGAAFALAYLARPEAILIFGLMGLVLGVRALIRRSVRMTFNAALMALAFAVTAAPYWLYLHDTLGRWALSGRVVELPAARVAASRSETAASRDGGGAATGIERMLWQDDNTPYVRVLYGLDESRTRLGSTYWGVPGHTAVVPQTPAHAIPAQTADAVPVEPATDPAATRPKTSTRPGPTPAPSRPGRWTLYGRALGTVIPWLLLPLIVIGIVGSRRSLRDELLVTVPMAVASVAVARLVGADPRTQLFIVPLAALYAAWGICRAGDLVDRRAGAAIRAGFVTRAGAFVVTCALLSTIGRWVYMGHAMGSPHHAVGAANRASGAALRGLVPEGEPVMSWHPAHALFSDREWRVLPYASLPDIVRYANATGTGHILLSAFYPGSKLIQGVPADHLMLEVPPAAPASTHGWRLDIRGGNESLMHGRLVYGAVPPEVER